MRWLWIISFLLLPVTALANEEDKGRLTRFLENTLSGEGREVVIDGFEGALSSNATMQRLTVKDAKGEWLRLEDISLVWNRAAVLRGRIEVQELTAARIVLPRLPEGEETPPSPEAASGPFQLPELPVSINIGSVKADRLELGEPVLGQEAVMTIDGRMTLAGGEGSALIDLNRIDDGPSGTIHLEAAFANADRRLLVDVRINEGAGGIASSAMNLPGTPSIDLTIVGEGPLDDYLAEIKLATDSQDRLEGTILTRLQPELDNNGAETGQTRVFGIDIFGDIAPLFAPEFEDFFGPAVSLTSIVQRPSDGTTRLDQLLVNTRSARIAGEMLLSSDGLPRNFAFDIDVSDPSGNRVLVPSANGLSLSTANLMARFDADSGDSWSLRGTLSDVATDDLLIAQTTVDGVGVIRNPDRPEVTADLSVRSVGIEAASDRVTQLAEAIGQVAFFETRLRWKEGDPLLVDAVDLITDRSKIGIVASVTGPVSDFGIVGRVNASIADLAMLEPFVNQPLSGRTDVILSGSVKPVTGVFDVRLQGSGTDVSTGIDPVDSVLGQSASINLSAERGAGGIDLRELTVRSEGLTADGTGHLDSGGGDLDIQVELDDVARVLPRYSGPLSLTAKGRGDENGWTLETNGETLGETTLVASLTLPKDGGGNGSFDLNVGRFEAFLPALPGPASISADIEQLASDWRIDVNGQSAAGFELAADGTVAQSMDTADLTLKGALPVQLVALATNAVAIQGSAAFDLALKGALGPQSLSGTVTTNGTTVALPELKVALTDLGANVTINSGRADIAVNSAVAAGGTLSVNGGVGLAAPFAGNLDVGLNQVRFQFENLLETLIDGDINLNGPLTGGANISGLIDLVETEIRVSPNAIGGASGIPEIAHLFEPSKVHQTRVFARAVPEPEDEASGGAATPFNLDLTVRANNKFFVRGLGLDAEFRGELGLQGATDNIRTSGEFELARGRLDFLARRLDLTEGLIRMEGDFIPSLRIIAETSAAGADFKIILEGLATDPDFRIESSPNMPDEEALAYILFGEDITSLSPFQAAQLASAVAALSGNGTEGLIGRLRSGLGFDNLDITTDDQGRAGVSAGRYLGENLYTEIGVNGDGTSSISLNFDVSPSFTVKGRVESDSDTGIGFFFKRDY